MGKQDVPPALQKLRKQIDQLDEQIAHAINERAALVEEVWLWKQSNQFPLIDQGREDAIFAKMRSLAREPVSEDSIERIFKCIIQEVRPGIRKAKKIG